MSDSYSAWCEEQETKLYNDTQSKIKKLRNSKKWNDIIAKCKENLENANIDILEICATCSSCHRLNRWYCSLLGSEITYPAHQSCDKWTIDNDHEIAREKHRIFNEDLTLQWNI